MVADPFRPDNGDAPEPWRKWGLYDPDDTEKLVRPKDSAGRSARVNVRIGLHFRYLAEHLVERPEFPEFKTESDVYRYCVGKVLADIATELGSEDEMTRRKLRAVVNHKLETKKREKELHVSMCKQIAVQIREAEGDEEELTEIVELCIAAGNAERNKRRKQEIEDLLRQARRELML